MRDVIAFFFSGRFNSTRRILSERSVIISSITKLLKVPARVAQIEKVIRAAPGFLQKLAAPGTFLLFPVDRRSGLHE
jgi:hypothetical protein